MIESVQRNLFAWVLGILDEGVSCMNGLQFLESINYNWMIPRNKIHLYNRFPRLVYITLVEMVTENRKLS